MEFHFLIFFISFTAFLSPSTSLSQSSYTDAQRLISFKSALRNPSLLQNWEPNQNPCDFAGVSCKDSRVSDIDLSYFNLEADFQLVSSFLMSLENVERLSLRFTNLTGNLSVDSGFRCSQVLIELNLAGNGLIGSVSEISSLRSCSSLKSLDLSNNRLGFSNVEDSVEFRLNWEKFDLSFNLISGNVLFWLLSGGCTQLKYLDLAGNRISGDIPVSDCRSLEFLNLSSNNFSGGIPSFGDCLSLRNLDLSDNRFSGAIGGRVSGCKGLQTLNLSNNDLSGHIPAFPCGYLIQLDLSFNHLAGNLPSYLSSCSTLESFNVSNNNFSGEFPAETLISMSNLKRLVLSYNDFNGSLPNSVSKLIKLELLDLSSNSLHSSLPSELCKNPKNSLKELYLQNNLFFGTIPTTLSNCSQLISLDLSFNYLTGTIPSSLGSLSQLRDLIMWLNLLEGKIPEQLMNIRSLENLILDNNKLTGSIPSGLSNCTILNWISLSSNLLSGKIPSWIGRLSNLAILKLGNNSFSGKIPLELGDCKSLIWLDLNSNHLTGTIPPSLAKQSGKIAVGLVTGKRYVYMKNDGSADCRGAGNLLEFAGIREERLNRVPTRHSCNFTRVYSGNTKYTFNNNGSMIFLDLSYNMLVGEIPKELGNMFHLSVLNLGHNSLSGFIPYDLGNLKNVGILDLSHNNLKGLIPNSLSGLSFLIEIDLSNNNLTGSIPGSGQLWTFPAYRYMNNSGLCGFPLPSCERYSDSNALLDSHHRKSHRKQASVAGSVAMGLLFALFCIFGFIIITVENKKRKNKKKKKRDSSVDINMGSRSHSGTGSIDWKLMGKKEALSINLATFEKPLLNLTFADLLEATNGFDNNSLVGSGGFGDVYKAQLKDGTTVAIKKLIHVSGQGEREFTAEMETIGKIKHHNLVPLLGYCRVAEERLLVYEFMKFGSLDDVLHDRRKTGIKLDWPARRKIAWGAAKGLSFLHHKCIPHIIHRDMKSSNVLIDKNLVARVSDFGMARLVNAVDTHLSVSTLAGTPGYVPPEYYQSFRCSTKGDVYSFGVVLLELLTGKQPTDSSDFGDNNLVGWVKQHAKLKITDVFDPILMREDPNLEMELLRHLKIACACLDDQPWRRPTMRDVMGMFKEIQAASGFGDDDNDSDDESFGMAKVAEVSTKEGKEASNKQ